MSNTLKQAGVFTLQSAMLSTYDRSKNIDIKNLILGFNITESMSKMSVRGTTTVFDGLQLMKTFPIIGEEFIEFTYTDYFDVTRTDTFFVYSVSDVKYPSDNNSSILQYTLNFVSVPKVITDDHVIMRAYNSRNSQGGIISDYVQQVYDEYYKRPIEAIQLTPKEIVIEPTDSTQDLVIPNLTPEETILFFARRAYSNNSKTQTYRFFENREKFYFATNDYIQNAGQNFVGYGNGLVDPNLAQAVGQTSTTIPVFRVNYQPDLGPERQQALMYEIIDVNFGDRVNTITDMRSGAYKKTIYEVDMLYGTQTKIEYDFSTDFDQPGQKLIHEGRFKDENLTKSFVRFVFKDYSSIGAPSGEATKQNTFYPELYTKKDTYFYHYKMNTIGISIYGRNSLFAGDIIELELIERASTPTNEIDVERSGRYFIESIENIFVENTYTQKLTLSKYGVGS